MSEEGSDVPRARRDGERRRWMWYEEVVEEQRCRLAVAVVVVVVVVVVIAAASRSTSYTGRPRVAMTSPLLHVELLTTITQ